jgi:hypothetical protein
MTLVKSAVQPEVQGGVSGMLRTAVVMLNRLIRQVSYMMPGLLMSAPASKTGTTSAKTWRTEAFTFVFRGKNTSAAAQEKALTATTHDVAASKEAWFVLSVQSDGTTFTITKAADQTIGTEVRPTAPDNEVVVGYAKVVTGGGGIFDATTDDFKVGGNVVSLDFEDAPAIEQLAVDGVVVTT